ncbi:MAG: type II toxin-antitoxin system RelE family toxin [Thermoanaerobaculia bacterium]
MKYEIEFRPSADRDFWKLDKSIRDRLRPKIDALSNDPRPPGCRKLEVSEGRYRIRVGDYRIVYEIRDAVLVILLLRIGHRREIYR